MCGIVGYVGDKNIESILLVGLERLSYRGYDSSGIAIITNGELSYWKKTGKIRELEKMLQTLTIKGTLGIGHTRWATHGEPNELNAHPQMSQNKKIAVVHNGIIENYLHLKEELKERGFFFASETDTEVIAHLIESNLTSGTLEEAVEVSIQRLTGAFAIAVIGESDPEKIVVARKGSPLIIGVGKKEYMVSSDVNSILPITKEIIHLEDGELAILTKKSLQIKKIHGPFITKKPQHIRWDAITQEKNGYDTFMLKEIFEQPTVARHILSKIIQPDLSLSFKHINLSKSHLKTVNRFIIQACGTSWHAGLITKYLMEKYARILTEVDISSEFRYRHSISQGNDIVLAMSQSGETADTLACLREAKSKFLKVLSLVNVKGSSIDRESDGVLYSYAGPEIGVASTKNFIAQLINLYLFTLYMAQIRGTLSKEEVDASIQEIKKIPDYIDRMLAQKETLKRIADKYYKSQEFLFIGRGVNYPSALEGALKLKEISYIHATGYPAGELKHGPISLVDASLPVVCIAPKTATYEKMLSNIQEVRSRKGKTIVIATEGDAEIAQQADEIVYIPKISEDLTPILVAIPLQLLAYFIAQNLQCDVDQPRNLAKSVTVE